MGMKENTTGFASGASPKAISKKLAMLFGVLLICSTLLAECLILGFGYRMMKNLIDSSLNNEVVADAGQINKALNSIFYYLNGIADSTEKLHFEDNAEIIDYLAQSVGRYDLIPTGAYIGTNTDEFLDPSGWGAWRRLCCNRKEMVSAGYWI